MNQFLGAIARVLATLKIESPDGNVAELAMLMVTLVESQVNTD